MTLHSFAKRKFDPHFEKARPHLHSLQSSHSLFTHQVAKVLQTMQRT
jgi:hypothetical protein